MYLIIDSIIVQINLLKKGRMKIMKRALINVLIIILLISPIVMVLDQTWANTEHLEINELVPVYSGPSSRPNEIKSHYDISTPIGTSNPLSDQRPFIPDDLKADETQEGEKKFIVQYGDIQQHFSLVTRGR
jgi:hypothetical protein